MIFFSHSSRIRILQLTFALVCSCSEGLLTTEKHHLVPFCLLIFCILCLSIQIKYFFFLDTQGIELKSVFHLLHLHLLRACRGRTAERFPANSCHMCCVELALDRPLCIYLGSKGFLRRGFSPFINRTAIGWFSNRTGTSVDDGARK